MSNNKIATVKSNLPKLIDLVKDVDNYEKSDDLNFLLNQPVPKKWISNHPYIKKEVTNEQGQKIKVPYEYLPIDKVEYLLRKIFKRYRIEVLREGTSFNGVFVSVRVHYLNPVFNEWDFHDGIGAIHLQVKSGSSPADLANINNGALSMAYPLAKTLAIKDACDMFGNLFGANLNRNDVVSYQLDEKNMTDHEKLELILSLLRDDNIIMTQEDRMSLERITDEKETASYDKAIKLLNELKTKTNE